MPYRAQVRCLLAVPGEAMVLHDGSSTSFHEFTKRPEDFLSSVEWDDEEDHMHWIYQVPAPCASHPPERAPPAHCSAVLCVLCVLL